LNSVFLGVASESRIYFVVPRISPHDYEAPMKGIWTSFNSQRLSFGSIRADGRIALLFANRSERSSADDTLRNLRPAPAELMDRYAKEGWYEVLPELLSTDIAVDDPDHTSPGGMHRSRFYNDPAFAGEDNWCLAIRRHRGRSDRPSNDLFLALRPRERTVLSYFLYPLRGRMKAFASPSGKHQ
jgi:hypothetical protein